MHKRACNNLTNNIETYTVCGTLLQNILTEERILSLHHACLRLTLRGVSNK